MSSTSKKVIVIGAGAAGLMAGAAASAEGARVFIYEKNEKPGKKIYITGKGRCNFTNLCDTQDFFGNVVRNPRFLYSAVYGFDAGVAWNFFEENGCPVKAERGNRAFPESDHASDITAALVAAIRRGGGKILTGRRVSGILTKSSDEGTLQACGIELEGGEKVQADAVILATGGLSYPSTGSTGDGYRMAEDLGIRVLPQAPSLVPLVTKEEWVRSLQGLSLKNAAIRIYKAGRDKTRKNKPVYEDFGEMLFTHFGISGPIILSASCYLDFSEGQTYDLELDLKPAMTEKMLTERMEREFLLSPTKQFGTALRSFFPSRLAETVADLSGIMPERLVKTVTEKERAQLSYLIKNLPVTITGTRGYQESIITRGGIYVKEIDPSTMEFKKVRNLYAAGEVIDVDALTGGFNLQIAWSTGHLAGNSAAEN